MYNNVEKYRNSECIKLQKYMIWNEVSKIDVVPSQLELDIQFNRVHFEFECGE